MSSNNKSSRTAARDGYSEEDIVAAIDDIKSGRRSTSAAAKFYKIPRTTLRGKLVGVAPVSMKMGPPTYLTQAEEAVVVKYIISAQKRALPVTKETIISLVSTLLEDERTIREINRDRPYVFGRAGSFTPGDKWFNLFLKRHPNIVVRTTEALSANRRNISQQCVKQWFSDVRSYLSENDMLEVLHENKRNYNIDESGFQFSPTVNKVLAEKGSKSVQYATAGKEKERLTVLANIGADGSLPPPLIIYNNLRIPMNVYDSLPTTLFAIGKSEKGYINFEVLYEYLTNAFNEWLEAKNIQRPVIVWSDKHESRINYHLVKKLSDLQIHLILIPPNTTHFMQPLDVGMFAPLKAAWKKGVNKFCMQNPNSYVTKENFATLFLPIYSETMTADKIQNSFRKCGLYPFNPDAPDYSKLTLAAEHSGDATIFEGIVHDGVCEASTQVDPILRLNVKTQTSNSCATNNFNGLTEEVGAGLATMKLLAKGYDDSVLRGKQFDALRLIKRNEWFKFIFERNEHSIPAIDLPASNTMTTTITPTTSLSEQSDPTTQMPPPIRTPKNSQTKPSRTSISPALLHHNFHPSPKKVVTIVRTVEQELRATSVLTSKQVVSMLASIREEKKNKEEAKENRKQKRITLAVNKERLLNEKKNSLAAKRKLNVGGLTEKKQKKKKVVNYSSDSSESEQEDEVIRQDSSGDSDVEKLQEEIDEEEQISCSSSSTHEEVPIINLSTLPNDGSSVGSYVACKLMKHVLGTKQEFTYEVFYGKVISSCQEEGEAALFEVKFLRERPLGKLNERLFFWPDRDDNSFMPAEELIKISPPSSKQLGKHRVQGLIFDKHLLDAVSKKLLGNES